MNVWKRYQCKTVTCPFYKEESQQVVYCEGLLENTSIHLAFGSSNDCSEYKKKICRGNHNNCPIFKMMEELNGV